MLFFRNNTIVPLFFFRIRKTQLSDLQVAIEDCIS